MLCVVFLRCSDIESDCFEIVQSQFGNPQISPFKFLSCSIFSDYVTCFATSKIEKLIKAARIGVICQGASSASHFLLARLQGYSFQFVFQLVLPAYTLQLPSICVLPTAFKTFCWNKLGILTGTSWDFSDKSSDTSARWANESTSHDANKSNGMLTSHAKRAFCDNDTCFGTNKCCSNRSHLPQCFIKAVCFLLAWLLCFYTENPRIFAGRRCSQYPRLSPP